jgi:predicted anti-sigma-YlaC factor YlaD
LDNELSPNEVAELQAHLAQCPACRHTYEAMQQVDHLFRAAAARMVAPGPGFTRRVEARLAQHHPSKPWQIWLAVGALLFGTLSLFGIWAVVSGLTLVTIGASLLDVGIFYQWLVTFIESATSLRVFFNLGGLFLKASFITMQQPLFWGGVLFSLSILWFWVRVMRSLSRRITLPVEFVF